jgi:hypothetical protein
MTPEDRPTAAALTRSLSFPGSSNDRYRLEIDRRSDAKKPVGGAIAWHRVFGVISLGSIVTGSIKIGGRLTRACCCRLRAR